MGPGSGEYGHVSEWLERQQRRIAELEAENRELRRQMDELRRGAGIAVVIQGRAYALAAPAPAPAHTGEHPAMPAGTLYPPAPMPPAAAPRAAHEQAAFAEDAWLTGPSRAAQAGPRRAQPQQATPAARPQSPSQDMTPQWLRDEKPRQAGPREPATWDEMAAAQDDFASSPVMNAHAYVRARAKSRPLTPRLEPAPVESLAQLTGQHPSVRKPPANQQRQGMRNPLKDSFLL